MRQFFQSGQGFLVAALIFLIVAVFAEKPDVYIVIGIVFFILSLNLRKKAAKGSQGASKGGAA